MSSITGKAVAGRSLMSQEGRPDDGCCSPAAAASFPAESSAEVLDPAFVVELGSASPVKLTNAKPMTAQAMSTMMARPCGLVSFMLWCHS
ncbi:hypothetical protein [Ornithinimicrobium sp. INDO-MA30-4]|uniref:hypothetical protein n=1 Tax=Ornithinimicrobium sp. INDO-MA30-4 TaxID=2908651 RepID=UPI001F443270|nr:hypothetical protein [Ornithinimicrobium sp. INDO-MA30-4]UJH69812.1 hypothetical protein L0A91_11135 [Ornithinimicrobium sp. INDO-MA30-4]